MKYGQFVVRKTTVKRIELVCPNKQRNDVLEQLYAEGFHVTVSGPKMLKFPRVSTTQQHIIAEKVLCK